MFELPLAWAMAAERVLGGTRLLADPSSVKSVLVLEYLMPLGCLVHMTPVFEALKADRPDLVVTVATRSLGAAVLRHNPRVDHLVETPDALTDTIGTGRSLRQQLTRLGVEPDCVLTGASDQRRKVGMLAVLVQVGWRGGFTLVPAMYQWGLDYLPEKSLIDNNLRLAALAGCSIGHREPKVYFSSADVAAVEELVHEVNPERKPLLVIVTQTSGGQRTSWHTERFAQVIRYANQMLGCCIVYVGTDRERPAIEKVRASAGGTGSSVAGRTSVTELAALLAMSDAVVSLDTGTMHVGRAVDVPMVVIGPAWQKPVEWLPLGLPKVRILRGKDREDIPEGYQLDEVMAEDVTTALSELLEIYPPMAASRAERIASALSSVDHRTKL